MSRTQLKAFQLQLDVYFRLKMFAILNGISAFLFEPNLLTAEANLLVKFPAVHNTAVAALSCRGNC